MASWVGGLKCTSGTPPNCNPHFFFSSLPVDLAIQLKVTCCQLLMQARWT
jgi:hypothetical protein